MKRKEAVGSPKLRHEFTTACPDSVSFRRLRKIILKLRTRAESFLIYSFVLLFTFGRTNTFSRATCSVFDTTYVFHFFMKT